MLINHSLYSIIGAGIKQCYSKGFSLVIPNYRDVRKVNFKSFGRAITHQDCRQQRNQYKSACSCRLLNNNILQPTQNIRRQYHWAWKNKLQNYRELSASQRLKFYCTSPKDDDAEKSLPTKENIYTVPNLLCVIRIGLAPAIGHFIVAGNFNTAIGLLVLGGVTDLLDGWIARLIPSQSTVMGSFLDPMADKILIGTLFLTLTYVKLIPLALTGLIIGRDLILIGAGFYIRYQSLDPPRTLSRYFNVAYPTAQLAPTFISKVNTGVQLSLVGVTLLAAVMPSYDLQSFLTASWAITASTTIASAFSYLFAKDTVKLLRESRKLSQARKSSGKSGNSSSSSAI